VAFIRIICDGAGHYGFGNLRRSCNLAASFKDKGYAVSVEAVSINARALLPAFASDTGEADLWLLDLPYNGDQWVHAARQEGKPIVALDFEGTVSPDLIISIFDRGAAPCASTHLVGLEYAIISRDIRRLAPAQSGFGAIVVIGGGDQKGIGEEAALKLHMRGVPVTLVDGPLAALNEDLPSEIVRLRYPPDLPGRMAASAWGVTSGGGAMMEMLCLGKPIFVVPRTPSEEGLANLLASKRALLGVGLEDLRIPSQHLCSDVSERGHALIDGNGTDRIVRAVARLL